MRLAVLTDQISRDVDTACEQITSWGSRFLELRGVSDCLIGANLTSRFLDDLCATLERWDVQVAGIAPQAFRVDMMDPAMRYHRRILLPSSLHLALLLKAPAVHICAPVRTFGMPGACPDDVLEVLAEAAELAGNLGLTLGLENQVGTWAETGKELAAIAKAIGHHALQITWDPATALMCGEAPLAGLEQVRSRLHTVRVRDISQVGPLYQGVLPGDGQAEVGAVLASLASSSFKGTLSLDPQLTPKLEGSRAAYESVERMLSVARRAAAR